MSGSVGAEGPPASDIAMRVARRRQELSLSLEEVAKRAGMNAGYLAYFERTPSAQLGPGALLRLAKALRTTLDALTGGREARPPGRGRASPRPVLETLTAEQSIARLAGGGVGRVVFSEGRRLLAMPVNFRFLGGELVFRTTVELAEAISSSPTVSFEVDRIDEVLSTGWSVLVTGPARIPGPGSDPELLDAFRVEPWAGGARSTVVSIRAEEVTGRSIRHGAPPREEDFRP